MGKIHDGEVPIDAGLVGRLISEQFPRWAGLPISEVPSTGTVNATYRIGDRLCARLPRVQEWAGDLDREWTWLPRLAPRLSLQTPSRSRRAAPRAPTPSLGRSTDGSRVGRTRTTSSTTKRGRPGTSRGSSRSCAGWGPPPGRRAPLRELDAVTREAIRSSRRVVDVEAVTAAWERALGSPAWRGEPVWIHADLLRPSLLVLDGRLRAVIDFGGGVGDPAADVIPA